MNILNLTLENNHTKLYLNIADAIRTAIKNGHVLPSERLPSARVLAQQLQVNRHTVMAAYNELVAQGWVETKQRQGYRVALTLPIYNSLSQQSMPYCPSEKHQWRVIKKGQASFPRVASDYAFNFAGGNPDIELFPFNEFRGFVNDALNRPSIKELNYGENSGFRPFINEVSTYLRRVRSVIDKEIIVVNGTQEALYILSQVLLENGDKVAVENLGYKPAWQALKNAGAELVGIKQTEQGRYAPQQEFHVLASTIQGVDWWHIRASDGESLDQSNLVHRVVDKIQDINGDGLVDIVVKFTKSSGVLERVNDYEFYFGQRNEVGQLEFAQTPNTVIQAEGTLTGLTIVDVNNDKRFEVLLSSFELSVGNIIGALLAGGIDQNVLLFALNEQLVYEEDAIISKEVELNFSLTSGQSGQAIVLLADVNGDNLDDFILSSGETKLKIFLGKNSATLFNRKAMRQSITLPKNGDLFAHHDINNDGKEDLLMSYSRLDDKEMANKVTVLMVK